MNESNYIVYLKLHQASEVLLIQSSSNSFLMHTKYHGDTNRPSSMSRYFSFPHRCVYPAYE